MVAKKNCDIQLINRQINCVRKTVILQYYDLNDKIKMLKKPNILVLMTDQHKATMAGCYGDRLVKTPSIDSSAQTGFIEGELYNMNTDPKETTNLWSQPNFKDHRDYLVNRLSSWIINTEFRHLAGRGGNSLPKKY